LAKILITKKSGAFGASSTEVKNDWIQASRN
jgi:hypothetical protein